MTQEDRDWVTAHMQLFTQSTRMDTETSRRVFQIYNNITGENKQVTSCGRCVTGVLNRIITEYNKDYD